MKAGKYLVATLVVVVVAGVVAIAVKPVGAPQPRPASAPAGEFSSERAMDVLRGIAAEPRPIGSARARLVRDSIYARLSRLGLGPHIQTATVVSAQDARVAGTVHNVAGRLPGRDPSRAVLLVAHYDSVPTAPGAADDGSGVAALLETARALRSGPPPRNDVIFLFTDGEERGLLGAQAFLRDDPWAFAAGVALNFDSAGSSSPALMYETSPGNGLLVREYVAAGAHPYASSLMYEVSRRQPIVSDFRPLVARGIPGMSFGMLDGPAHNHTAYDSLANFDEARLQHTGETALAVTRRLGDLDLWRLHRPDVVYFDVVDSVAVVYPLSLTLPLALLAAVAFAAAAAVAVRRRLLTRRGVAWSALGTAAGLAASLGVMGVVWAMYRTAYEERAWSDTGVVVSDLYRLGLVLLAAAVVITVYAALLRRLRAWDLAIVALAWWLAATVALSLLVPGAGYLLTWPLIGGSVGLTAAAFIGERVTRSFAAVVIVLAGAVPGLLLVGSATHLLLLSAGLKQVVTVLAVWLVAGLLVIPLAAVVRAFKWWLPAALALAGAVVLFSVGSAVAFDSEHPKFTSVFYRVTPEAAPVWQTVDPLDDYTSGFLRERLRSPFQAAYFPHLGTRDTLVGAAPDYGLRPPELSVLSDVTEGDRRTVRLRLRPRRDAAVVSLLVHTVVGNLAASVEGQRLRGRDTTLLDGTTVRWSFDYHAPPPEGVVVVLSFAAGPAVSLRAVDLTYGLPAGAAGQYPRRPAGMLAGRIGDAAITETTLRLPASPDRTEGRAD
jgi:hypothetical protein